MRSYDHTSSPVMALQPQLPPQPSFNNMNTNRPIFSSPFAHGSSPSPPTSSWSNLAPTVPTLCSAAGRKRSRDEAAFEDDYFPIQQPTPPAPENEEEWEYGEGMTLLKPRGKGYIISAESQTGTWADEKVAEPAKAVTPPISTDRPNLRSAKSQRLDFTSTPGFTEEVMSDAALITPVAASPTNGPTEPTVDDFTRHLGVGWSLISADEDIQAAARGWTKFIENHYPVTGAKIQLQSRGLASYLIESNEGFFLFGEDLKQGRLVSTSLEKTWLNLRGPVPIFDGEGIMEAGATPKTTSPFALNDGLMMSTFPEIKDLRNQTMEVEMDMS